MALARLAEPLVDLLDLLAELRDQLHVGVAVVVELVRHDAVEALALPLELVEQRGVHRRYEEESVEQLPGLRLRLLDDRADLDLLLALEELHLPHLVQVHPDRVLDHVRRARLLLVGLRVLRLEELLDVLLAHDLDAERLEDLQVLVALDGVDDVRRQDLVELLVGDEAAVRLAAALDVLDDVVELRLAQDRQTLHRRQDVAVGRVDGLAEDFLGDRHVLLDGRALAVALGLGALDLGGQHVGVERGGLRLRVLVRRKRVVVEVQPGRVVVVRGLALRGLLRLRRALRRLRGRRLLGLLLPLRRLLEFRHGLSSIQFTH